MAGKAGRSGGSNKLKSEGFTKNKMEPHVSDRGAPELHWWYDRKGDLSEQEIFYNLCRDIEPYNTTSPTDGHVFRIIAQTYCMLQEFEKLFKLDPTDDKIARVINSTNKELLNTFREICMTPITRGKRDRGVDLEERAADPVAALDAYRPRGNT